MGMVQDMLTKQINENSPAKTMVKQMARELADEPAGSERPLEERLKPENVAKMHEMMAQMSPEEAQAFREDLESLGRDSRRMKAEAQRKKEAGAAGNTTGTHGAARKKASGKSTADAASE